MSYPEVLKNFVLTTLGHAASGACVGSIYEVTQLLQGGNYSINMLLTAGLIGGSLGFFKTIVEEIAKMKEKKVTAVGTKKGVKTYLGF